MLMLTKERFLIFNPHTGQTRSFTLPPDKRVGQRHDIVIDSKGNVYFFRMGNLYRYHTSGVLELFPETGPTTEFRSLFLDNTDVLWAGTNGHGVRKYNLRAGFFLATPYQYGFTKDVLKAAFDLPETTLKRLPEIPFDYNFRYTFDKSGDFWFNTGETPLFRLRNADRILVREHFPVKVINIERADQAISLCTDPEGTVWAAYDENIWYRAGENWRKFSTQGVKAVCLQLVVDREAV